MTAMRSASSRISSRSSDTSSTAAPRLRWLDDLRANIGDGREIEPETGVGDDQHVDLLLSSRASTARCTLPPERSRIGVSVEGVLTL